MLPKMRKNRRRDGNKIKKTEQNRIETDGVQGRLEEQEAEGRGHFVSFPISYCLISFSFIVVTILFPFSYCPSFLMSY